MINNSIFRISSLLIFVLALSFSALAQKGTVSGKIVDEKKEPIFMASIVIEGTTIGTTTDFDGNYTLETKSGTYNLIFSFIGLKTQKQSVTIGDGSKTSIDITLTEDRLMLDDAVVVGFGRRQKRDVTGSITKIQPKDIGDATVSSIENAMQGRASGIQVTAANGAAGAAIKVNVRGTNSISAGSEPLYVIDGIPMTSGDFSPGNLGSRTNAMADLDPNDIESIEVLKDASSAAIYGARGSNGVILITTKKGSSGKTKFNASYKTGTITATNRLDFLSASEHLALRDSAGLNDSPTTNLGSSAYPWTRAQADSLAAAGGSDWIDEVLRVGRMHEANISAAGGNEKTKFYIAGSYKNEEGFLVGNNYERINGRINIDNQATEKLDIGVSIGLSNSKNNRVPMGDAGGLGLAQQKMPYLPIYNADGTYYDPYSNPLWQLENMSFVANVFRTLTKIYGDLEIYKGLRFRSEYGIDVLNQIEEEYNYRNTQDESSTSNATDRRTFVFNWTTNNFFSYTKDINENNHFNVILGNSLQKSQTKGVGLSGYNFSNDYLTEPGNVNAAYQSGYSWETGYAFTSFFTRVFYKLNNRYLLSASLRSDGSSRFGPENRYGLFPTASLGWIITDETFMQNISMLSYLKFNASWGLTGNAEIGDYSYYGLFSTSSGYNGENGLTPSSLANPELHWEKCNQTDLTMDYGFLDNKIAGNITYYNKITSDMLTYIILPSSSGYSGIWQNVGKMKNYGLEFTLNTKNINKELKWSTDFNISLNRNKVLDVSGLPPDAFEGGQPGEGRVIVGYPAGQAYVVQYAGVQQSDADLTVYDLNGNQVLNSDGSIMTTHIEAGDDVYYDVNGNLMSSDHPYFYDNRIPMGNPTPKFYGGINNTFSYKNFDINFLFSFVFGNTIYDDPAKQQIGAFRNVAQRPEILDYWSEENTETEVPEIDANYTAVNSSRFLYNASYIRLRNVSIGYSLPKETCKKMNIYRLRVYLSGTNLWLWTKYPGWDPEVLRDVDTNSQQGNVSFAGPSYQTPQAKTIN
ncbi:MAG: hypothetical protein A2236_04335, partial [Bacteroidetes bacterium RIFOXYA2_FULL_33_7]